MGPIHEVLYLSQRTDQAESAEKVCKRNGKWGIPQRRSAGGRGRQGRADPAGLVWPGRRTRPDRRPRGGRGRPAGSEHVLGRVLEFNPERCRTTARGAIRRGADGAWGSCLPDPRALFENRPDSIAGGVGRRAGGRGGQHHRLGAGQVAFQAAQLGACVGHVEPGAGAVHEAAPSERGGTTEPANGARQPRRAGPSRTAQGVFVLARKRDRGHVPIQLGGPVAIDDIGLPTGDVSARSEHREYRRQLRRDGIGDRSETVFSNRFRRQRRPGTDELTRWVMRLERSLG